jgi:hypothetical protein
MGNRFKLRDIYIQGWYETDETKLLISTREDFIFEDPNESSTISRTELGAYMLRWNKWTSQLGANNQWRLSHEVRQDENVVLTDWEWWELLGTDIQGAAIVLTSDEGVFLERITYYNEIEKSPIM